MWAGTEADVLWEGDEWALLLLLEAWMEGAHFGNATWGDAHGASDGGNPNPWWSLDGSRHR